MCERERVQVPPEKILSLGNGLTYNATTGEIVVGAASVLIMLGPLQNAAFGLMVEHSNKVIPYATLTQGIYGEEVHKHQPWLYAHEDGPRIRSLIKGIRGRLREIDDELPQRLQTIKTVGVRWNNPSLLEQG